MIIDPHIAIIRTSDESPALYEGVMRRVAERSERPQGVLMHYAALHKGRFEVSTVFRDNASMLDGFIGFSAPEAQNEMVATGRAIDLTRDEYPLEHLYVEPHVETKPFSFVPAGDSVACSSEPLKVSQASYRRMVDELGLFDRVIPGRLAHLAYNLGDGIRGIDFWETREHGEAWYRKHVHDLFDRLEPGERTEQTSDATWIPLHSFVVSVPPDDPTRNFVRHAAGPSTL